MEVRETALRRTRPHFAPAAEIRRASNRASAPSPGILDGPPVKWQNPGLAWNVRDGFLLGSDYQPKRATDLSTETPLTEGPAYEVISITP